MIWSGTSNQSVSPLWYIDFSFPLDWLLSIYAATDGCSISIYLRYREYRFAWCMFVACWYI